MTAKPPLNTVGEILRKTREKQKLSLEDVYRDTKIAVHVLGAMEQDDFESFESETYLKGFLKNYAGYLKLDVDEILLTLERQRGRVHMGKGTLWDIEETMSEEKLKSPRLISRFVVPLLILVIVILSVMLIREHRQLERLKKERSVGQLVEPGCDGIRTAVRPHSVLDEKV